MSDISTSERRLIAALERLDFCIDRASRQKAEMLSATAAAPSPAPVAPDDAPVSDEVMHLHDRQGATLEAMRVRLEEAHERLAGAGEQAVRLTAANDGLAAANRSLIAASSDWGTQGQDAVRAALEAEIEALHAARAAEIAQMSEILDELDRMLGINTPSRPASRPRKPGRKGPAPVPAGAADLPPQNGVSTEIEADDALRRGNGPKAVDSALPNDEGLPELTVEVDPDDFPPEDILDGDLPPDDALTRTAAPDRSTSERGAHRTGAQSPSLFGSVYGDDSDDPQRDDEERR